MTMAWCLRWRMCMILSLTTNLRKSTIRQHPVFAVPSQASLMCALQAPWLHLLSSLRHLHSHFGNTNSQRMCHTKLQNLFPKSCQQLSLTMITDIIRAIIILYGESIRKAYKSFTNHLAGSKETFTLRLVEGHIWLCPTVYVFYLFCVICVFLNIMGKKFVEIRKKYLYFQFSKSFIKDSLFLSNPWSESPMSWDLLVIQFVSQWRL